MMTVKRLYFYAVLAVVGIPVLMGMADIARLLLGQLFEAVGVALPPGAGPDAEGVSLAVALVLVGAPVWGVHAWLLRRSTRGSAGPHADELASAPRAAYFLVVLVVTLLVMLSNLSDALSQLFRAGFARWDAYDLIGPIASTVVFGLAWLAHLRWRRADLRLEPARTARDWSTRLYLYGALLVVSTVAMVTVADSLTILAQELSGMRPAFEGPRWWQDAITGSLAVAVTMLIAWLIHLGMADRLTRAPDPMGEAHRESRSRMAYFLGITLVSAFAVLISVSSGSSNILDGLLGTWESVDGSRFEAEAYGPLVALVPFLAAWWWSLRRVTRDSLSFGGRTLQASVVRVGRLLIAFVGLAGLSFGVAWAIGASIDQVLALGASGAISDPVVRADGTLGVAAALMGLIMWMPAWSRIQRERARDPIGMAASTARRAYLSLVSGVAVVAAMASLSWLVYQLIRSVAEAGPAEDSAWAAGALLVATTVLSYHLLTLRSDLKISAAAEAATPADLTTRAGSVEELEITGPLDADFEALNASVRSHLPEGYQLRVVRRARSH